VPAALLPTAIVLHLTVFQLSTVIGPAAGGFVYAGNHPERVYEIAAALFVLAFLLFALLRARPAPAPAAEPFERAFTAGVRYVWNDKRLLGAMSLDLFAVLLGGATALLPLIAKETFNSGPNLLGILRSAPSGAADMLSVTVRHTLIQVATPDAMRGRVSAVSMVFINTSNELGEFESGLT